MNTDPASTDVFAILALAQANWPQDPVAGSEAVWRKWGEPLRRYRFEEVAAALDSLARTHRRVPSLAELLGELGAGRSASKAHIQGIVLPPDHDQLRWPRVPLGPDYVIGPYSLAFAEMNLGGWTPQRMVACIRSALQSPTGAAVPAPSVAGGTAAALAADGLRIQSDTTNAPGKEVSDRDRVDPLVTGLADDQPDRVGGRRAPLARGELGVEGGEPS